MKNQKRNFLKIISTVVFISLIFTQSNIVSCFELEYPSSAFNCPINPLDESRIYILSNNALMQYINDNGLEGQGTENSPYIIEGKHFNLDSGTCIEIHNTDIYLIIRNCTIEEQSMMGYGIYLDNVTNVNIENNTILNHVVGTFLVETEDITISENNINNNYFGIYLSYSNNILVSNNEISFTRMAGIHLNNSNFNSIIGDSSSNNLKGIFLEYSTNNLVSGVFTHNEEEGIELKESSYNEISSNNITNNSIGVSLNTKNHNNLIYYNNIFDNRELEAYEEDSTENFWDNGTVGNYWGDYTEKYPDAKKDGMFWDTPYEIEGDGSGIDNFPLVEPITPDFEINGTNGINGFPALYMLIFFSVGVYLLKRKKYH